MGPLGGVRVIEFAGLGPGPFAAMLMSDMGAEVIRIARKDSHKPSKHDVTARGRRTIALDMKKPDATAIALRLIEQMDALIEGYRPGVMERLGVGPEVCLQRNPRLVYGRMTGWGQTGPLAAAAGHDINYIALSGALHAIGPAGGKPVPPLNLVGDFGGGALYLAFGIVCALLEARRSGNGQVVDAAMTDGAASLMSAFYGLFAGGRWQDARGGNLLDSGAPFYDTYETRDGKWIAVGSLEPQFYRELVKRIGLPEAEADRDRGNWPTLQRKFAEIFRKKTRDEWDAILLGTDACYAPVLSLSEAPNHPHNLARRAFVEVGGVVQPAPAPRFSVTEAEVQGLPQGPDSAAVLAHCGFSSAEIENLMASGVI